ncbi:ferric reductase-like transmembrane domain-containing protein [Frigidibacter sp. RF13]|uniref:ferric reductase-like transmembrane domain-containing protein n=1 Tax=Frigidibacter sp. RF13 TaxID=2997340 RepID=UPI0022713B3D|nr:ferric reductase-like transmembrane domain-containing protein [Frigidibacter sp. RF13]MCY1126671.1 ferric reductase-like transmembrane domain-containing protein [Frigidibacter sp. RF13]
MAGNGRGTGGKAGIYLFWALLALPGLWLTYERFVTDAKHAYVPLSGEIAAVLLFVTLMVTPLMLLLGPLPWLKARRRNLGVASFLYTLLHLLFWVVNANLAGIARSFTRPEIATGWVAGAIMLALAWTSTDAAVRRMGPGWKRLQRWVYPAAILTFIHWATTDGLAPALLWSLPLILLSVWRIIRARRRYGGA